VTCGSKRDEENDWQITRNKGLTPLCCGFIVVLAIQENISVLAGWKAIWQQII
jgi:hypothetical protein